jgi:hypothetical protein
MRFDFHERFGVSVDVNEAKRRFVNRIFNRVFNYLFFDALDLVSGQDVLRSVADEIGISYERQMDFKAYTGEDFYRVLQALEGFYKAVSADIRTKLDAEIIRTLSESEIDIGVRWEQGRFIRSGAKLLDDSLVNVSLRWLSDHRYDSVLQPYSKGLEHFLQAGKRPELLADAVTDMYEALEALSKIVTGRDTKDLSANAQLFLKEVSASEPYKNILKEYISYANTFRHAVSNSQRKPVLTVAEVESFIYLTGIFIRLALQKG